jgi:hypothetical protein
MKRRATNKRFDCVVFKRRAQSKVYEDTRQMTVAEQVEYFRRRARSGALGSWWKRVSTANVANIVVQESPTRYSTKRKRR